MGYDLLAYLRGDGTPAGVTQVPGGDAIYQTEQEPNSTRFYQKKGSFGVPAQWEELWSDDTYIYRGLDTSPADGRPYTLRDDLNQRGSKWAKRQMNIGEVFERNPHVLKLKSKASDAADNLGQHRSWLKLVKHHPTWKGQGANAKPVSDVLELWWLANSPNDTTPEEIYYFGKGLGLVGFTHRDLRAYTNHVWPAKPPAPNVPVLQREALSWWNPEPIGTTTTPPAPGNFWLLNPCDFPNRIFSAFGPRPTPETNDGSRTEHHNCNDHVATGGSAPYRIRAAAPGRVVIAGWDATGFGWLVKLDHGDGRETLYAHMVEGSLKVRVGDTVTRGQHIGDMGTTGRSTGVHLHHEYRVNGVPTDPTPLLRDSAPVTPPPQPPAPDPVPPPTIPPDTYAALLSQVARIEQLQQRLQAEHSTTQLQLATLVENINGIIGRQ